MAQLKKFFLNGQLYSTNKKINLLNLLNYFNYNQSLLVVEYNNSICNKEDWSKLIIQTNDKIEVVTIVGGG